MIYFDSIIIFFNSPLLLLFTQIFSFSIKIYFILLLTFKGARSTKIKSPWFFLICVLIGSLAGDFAWILKLSKQIGLHAISYSYLIFIFRIAWAFLLIQYQSIGLLMVSLTEKTFRLSPWKTTLVSIGGSASLYFFFLAFIDFNHDQASRLAASQLPLMEAPFEFFLHNGTLYYLIIMSLGTLYIGIKKIRASVLPIIIKKQLQTFIIYLLCPYLFAESLQFLEYIFQGANYYNYALVNLSTILLIFAVHHCIKRVLGLRFMNFNNHVESINSIDFLENFKTTLEHLSHTTNIFELKHITQTFFKDALKLPNNRVNLEVRSAQGTQERKDAVADQESQTAYVENFITTHTIDGELFSYIAACKILICDELEFSNFYEEEHNRSLVIHFLKTINADIFIPIYEKRALIGYILVDRHSRSQELYGHHERDQMLVFVNYLANIINLLQNRNLSVLLQQEKSLQEELYLRHQQINQYKESIHSFLRTAKEKEIGIIFYKNKRFTFGNKSAQELIKINLNQQVGHSITQELRMLAENVLLYKSPQRSIINDEQGNKLVFSGIMSLEQNNVIITLHYPEISDFIRSKIDLLNDPSRWDYLLYLETTETGRMINQLIPSNLPIMLNFKIKLLEIALSKKSTLIDVAEDDLTAFVKLLHETNLRSTLHILDLTNQCTTYDSAIKLFGINPNLGIESTEIPMLEKLNNTGTLVIKNIHFLDRESQEYLAEFIKTGMYRRFKSDQKATSSVRILCTSSQHLQQMVKDGQFSKTLFHELTSQPLIMPSMLTLPDPELTALAQGFTKQTVKSDLFKNLYELNDRELSKIIAFKSASLFELNQKVVQLLTHKSKKNQILQDPDSIDGEITDPELEVAAHLGKNALKDPKIMALLWDKFKNQNKIATFLGVNRSSVNRRCKDYNLL